MFRAKGAAMASKLIKLKDGTLVEVEVTGTEVQQISGGFAKKVDTTIDSMKEVLSKACQPIIVAVRDLREKVADIEHVEVEVGLSFDIEGNIYITKANLGANILVRMTLKDKE